MGLLAKAAVFVAMGCAPLCVAAESNPVVIELFTSQGCSSCPPADEILTELAGRDDVLPLALHVDYWDYIGWKDEFAQPKFTQRQQNYAVSVGARTVYTPQFIVGGSDPVVGAHPMEVMEAVAEHVANPAAIDLTVTRSGSTITVTATTQEALARGTVLQLVRYVPEQVVSIERGENAGRTIHYSNVVTDWKAVGDWAGQGPFQIVLEVAGRDRAAVILQEPGFGRILAAARAD